MGQRGMVRDTTARKRRANCLTTKSNVTELNLATCAHMAAFTFLDVSIHKHINALLLVCIAKKKMVCKARIATAHALAVWCTH